MVAALPNFSKPQITFLPATMLTSQIQTFGTYNCYLSGHERTSTPQCATQVNLEVIPSIGFQNPPSYSQLTVCQLIRTSSNMSAKLPSKRCLARVPIPLRRLFKISYINMSSWMDNSSKTILHCLSYITQRKIELFISLKFSFCRLGLCRLRRTSMKLAAFRTALPTSHGTSPPPASMAQVSRFHSLAFYYSSSHHGYWGFV